MTGFEDLVEQARRELSEREGAAGAANRPAGEALSSKERRAEGDRFELEVARELLVVEGHFEPFLLREETATTPLRRLVGGLLRRLLRFGGLGKFLGSNQFQTNQALLRALRVLQSQVRAHDDALIELAERIPAGKPAGDGQDTRR